MRSIRARIRRGSKIDGCPQCLPPAVGSRVGTSGPFPGALCALLACSVFQLQVP